jgi:uncharacterized protein (TIGR02246 family)
MSDAAMASMLDEWAIRKLSMEYAAAADRGDGPGFAAVFAADAVIEGPGFKVEGLEYIAGNPGMLKQMYASTLHTVLNQTLTVTGDTAEGETYCLAYHLNHPKDGVHTRLDWAIRYQDKYRREDGRWLFTYRRLIVDWTEVSTVTSIGG